MAATSSAPLSPLLNLPPELRNRIYDYVFVPKTLSDKDLSVDITTLPTIVVLSGITATCKQLRNETLLIQRGVNEPLWREKKYHMQLRHESLKCLACFCPNESTDAAAAQVLATCTKIPHSARIRRFGLRTDLSILRFQLEPVAGGEKLEMDIRLSHVCRRSLAESKIPRELTELIRKNAGIVKGDGEDYWFDMLVLGRVLATLFGVVADRVV